MAQGYQQQQQWGARPSSASGGGKGLPIAIGAGLAIGVFVGLLVIRGTGAEAGESGSASDSADAGVTTTAAATDAAAVAASPDAAPIATIDAAPAKPPAPVLTFAVEPADAEELSITVDGEAVSGTTFEVALAEGKTERKVRVKARAKGYRSFSRRLTISASETLEIKLKKRGRSTSGGHTTPGGLIDL